MRYGYSHNRGRQEVLVVATLAILFLVGFWVWNGAVRTGTGPSIPIWRVDTKQLVTMPLEEYIKGVVAAEMPASFHLEALKAQAVVARTYALYHLRTGRRIPDNPNAVVSTDYRSGQAWVDKGSLKKTWGLLGYFCNWRRISRAVDETRGMVLVYAGAPILALYHSTSGGRTEDSENYWNEFIPYLRSTISPWETSSPHFRTEARFTLDQIRRKLGIEALPGSAAAQEGAPETGKEGLLKMEREDAPKADQDGAAETEGELIRVAERFPSGRAKTVDVMGRRFTGRQVRERLGLKSNWFEVETIGDTVVFKVRGYGHGVGMSQYGAHGLAEQGYSFKQILAHYYPGVSLSYDYAGDL